MAMKIDLSKATMLRPMIAGAVVSTNPKVEALANKRVERIMGMTPIIPQTEVDGGMHQGFDDLPQVHTQSQLDGERAWIPEGYADRETYDRDQAEEYERDFDDHTNQEPARPERLVDPNFTWDESQVEAIVGLVKVQHACMIGAAGTGKTTCEKRVVDMLIHGDEALGVEPLDMAKVNLAKYWDRHGQLDDPKPGETTQHVVPSILLCSYTGQATQNIKKNFPKSWHGNIMTIHSALGYYPEQFEYADPSTNTIKQSMRFVPFYDKTIKMPWDVIIIDEASMANLDLWHQLLDASKPSTRFYLIGDINQLPPPIGQGILGFAMSAWPVFELRHIHRQKEAAANRIIETAWGILHGKAPAFDDPKTNPDWRVIGMEIQHDPAKAAQQVISIAEALRKVRINVVNKDKETGALVETKDYPIYDPWRDRILTCMNGFNPGDPASYIGQAPLNETLALLFSQKQERTIIDAGREIKRFAVGYRVMATRNEPPSTPDRVTNGMTGIITEIIINSDYTGDARLFGLENEVKAARKEILDTLGKKDEVTDFVLNPQELAAGVGNNVTEEKDERIRGSASHSITVDFNGIIRVFRTKVEVEQLQLAYASTVHKTQGSEMDLAIVIVHHAQKKMLCRESLYTAVTRATKRLVILYTPHGMKLSIAKQKIFGDTLGQKVRQYLLLIQESLGPTATKIRLTQED